MENSKNANAGSNFRHTKRRFNSRKKKALKVDIAHLLTHSSFRFRNTLAEYCPKSMDLQHLC